MLSRLRFVPEDPQLCRWLCLHLPPTSYLFLYSSSSPAILFTFIIFHVIPHHVLPLMSGEKITTGFEKGSNATRYPLRRWTIIKKLSELPKPITPEDSAAGMGPAFTEGKYSCRDGNDMAYMCIYKQIPRDGTRLGSSDVRKTQARPPRKHVEMEALKFLTERQCSVTPRLLGYRVDKQGEHDIVPGGYILYIVWERVNGESLDIRTFWALPHAKREIIRQNFEKAYRFSLSTLNIVPYLGLTRSRELLKFGYEPVMSDPSKIILDMATLDVYVLQNLSVSQANGI